MNVRPFQPKAGASSITVANAVAASAPALIDENCEQVVLTNTSATAIAYWRCDAIVDVADVPVQVATATGFPIPPGMQIRLTMGLGLKKFSVIASAADGSLIITPGYGD